METLTVMELMHLLNISRQEAIIIIGKANNDLYLTLCESADFTEEFRNNLLSRNYAPIEYLQGCIPKVNSIDPRYHNRCVLDVIMEGLGRGLSLRMKMELKSGIHQRRSKTLLRFANPDDKKINY